MQVGELPVAARAEVAAGHVNVEGDVLLAGAVHALVVWHGDGQRALLAVVHVAVAWSVVARFQSFCLLEGSTSNRSGTCIFKLFKENRKIAYIKQKFGTRA